MDVADAQRSGAAFDEKCQAQRSALSDCATRSVCYVAYLALRALFSAGAALLLMSLLPLSLLKCWLARSQARKAKVRSTLNFHLKRLSAAMKR